MNQTKVYVFSALHSLFSCMKKNQVREWLGQHPDNVIVVHCKVRLFMTKMYWSTFDLDHYKRTRHWSSFKKRSFDSAPNLDCDATGREGENRDDDLRLVDRVRRLLFCCPKVPP